MNHEIFRPIPVMSDKEKKRFWSKVLIQEDDECWPWQRCTYKGYGQVGIGYQVFLAHRVAYYLSTGIDPGQKCVLHRCDNPPCCNPKHHALGSKGDNTKDMLSKGRHRVVVPESIHKGITAIDVTFMREMFWCGEFSQSHIARSYRIPIPTASAIVTGRKRKEVPMPVESTTRKHLLGAPRGSRSYQAEHGISENDVFLMREMFCLARISATEISKLFKISFSAADSIVCGKSWKHVPFPEGGRPGMRSPRRKANP